MPIPYLSSRTPRFPDPEQALQSPNGLLAAGGQLTVDWLVTAYVNGIFPWFNEDSDPVLWWSPDPRGVLRPPALRVSRSLRKRIRHGGFRVTMDQAFPIVIAQCAAPRFFAGADVRGTWITRRMQTAYLELHAQGFAHSVEVWQGETLAGGLYGVSTGKLFFGESMFTHVSDASKIALVALCAQVARWGFPLIDCQMQNSHLASLGVESLPRRVFLDLIKTHARGDTRRGRWTLDTDIAALAFD
ncbi:MAG: leucyl/phenylalanyl-tRNA--protein transferase [Gammaproteobacteria bacterium]